MPGPVRDKSEPFQQLEAVMLRQMLKSSGAFRASDSPGAQLRTDMFIETLADAVAKAGGLGIARMLERQIGPQGGPPSPAPPPATFAPAYRTTSRSTPGVAASQGVDDLDDPNSSAPLPEDPTADSIDDYQPAPASSHAPSARHHVSIGPVSGEVTSPFGQRIHPISGDSRFHTGVDLRAPSGSPIRAAAEGVVREAGKRGGYGNAVELDHGDGTSTLYAHASALLVKPGQHVDQGQPIALVGQTGSATGPHLHFELRRHGHPVEPQVVNLPNPTGRALNSYRERAEDTVGGTSLGAEGGKP
ncbi:MAG TPA: peptidoglycan DD-metalloendopeptidase family protein [Polyangia bacterium]|nr:peptidoglycan DD-metalloendopeptidase family protein [Polyangia bacterium]